MVHTGFPSFSGLGLEDRHVPTFLLLLYVATLYGLFLLDFSPIHNYKQEPHFE